MLSGCQHGWCRRLGKHECSGGCSARPCTATGVACRAPPISTRLGRADRPIYGVVHMCGDQAVRQGEHRSWAGRCGGRVSGLRPSAGLCPVVQVSSARICHCPLIAADGQCRGARVWYVYALSMLYVGVYKSSPGQGSHPRDRECRRGLGTVLSPTLHWQDWALTLSHLVGTGLGLGTES